MSLGILASRRVGGFEQLGVNIQAHRGFYKRTKKFDFEFEFELDVIGR